MEICANKKGEYGIPLYNIETKFVQTVNCLTNQIFKVFFLLFSLKKSRVRYAPSINAICVISKMFGSINGEYEYNGTADSYFFYNAVVYHSLA